jgi:multidrug efflux pump
MVGERLPVLRLQVDAQRLAAYGLTSRDVGALLGSEAVESATTDAASLEWLLATSAEADPAAILDRVVKVVDGADLRLGDVAQLERSAASDDTVFHFNLRPAVGLAVVPARGAAIAGGICAALADLRPALPRGVSAEMQGALGLE